MTDLTRDLLTLEQTLTGLKQARQYDDQRYSVVPYRGRLGQQRRPIYLECRSDSLVFHRGGPGLQGETLSPAEIRSQVQRFSQPGAADSTAETALYLLLLVRPDGIDNYYRTRAALEGLPIEYGYELVDANWVLDFPDERGDQPLLAADVSAARTSWQRRRGQSRGA